MRKDRGDGHRREPAPSSVGLPPAHGTPGDRSLAPRALTYLNVRESLTTVVVAVVLCAAVAFLPDPVWRAILWAVVSALTVVSLAIELPWLNRGRSRTRATP